MTDLVAWFGPVAAFQVQGATVPGAAEHFSGCHGATVPLCRNVVAQLTPPGGSPLDGLSSAAGVPRGQLGDVFLGAFSAGGRSVRDVLAHQGLGGERIMERVRAVMLSDATYASWRDPAGRVPLIQQPLLDYAGLGAQGGGRHLLVATASPSPNGTMPTGVEVLRQLRSEIEQATGQRFERLDHFFGIEPAPEAAYRLGDVILAEYPMEPLGHGHTEIAPAVWQRILLPWLEGAAAAPHHGDVPDPRPLEQTSFVGLTGLLVGAAAVALGYLAVAFTRRTT